MADLSNNSFIPKRGPVKRGQGSGARQVYIFTLISYILMFATLLSTGGVYLYGKHIDKELEKAIVALNAESKNFSVSDMQEILDFDLRLNQAQDRLNNSVSIVSVFDALEAATIDTVKISSLDLQREKDDKFTLTAAIETDSFDSTIFQRGEYQRNETIESVLISDVVMTSEVPGSEGGAAPSESLVSFTAKLEVPLSSVPYEEKKNTISPITITEPVVNETAEEEDVVIDLPADNIENI